MGDKKQKDTFLASEGDQWYLRNKENSDNYQPEDDRLLREILELKRHGIDGSPKLLEIGCSASKRLLELQNNDFEVYGIDPSKTAIEEASNFGINAMVGTADELPYDDGSFDMLVFGFCLYLCDRDDLFKIASEANRVLKRNGYILILDFYSESDTANAYHHLEGISSYKMDYRKLFEWHPSYSLVKQEIGSHHGFQRTDDKNEWIAISILRKNS